MVSIILAKNCESKKACGKSQYRTISLIDLIKKIANSDDSQALFEFHNNRSVFSFNNGPSLVLIEYLIELRESVLRGGSKSFNLFEVADMAYDLTKEKFTNLPTHPKPKSSPIGENVEKMKRKGPDCRLYYRAYLKRCAKTFNEKSPDGEIMKELQAAKIMQGLVRRQFYYSLLEAERKLKNPFRSRYNWNVNGGTITVYLPVAVKGLKRRKWLEERFESANPLKKGERERIQGIINREFLNERIVEIENVQNLADEKHCFGYWKENETEVTLAEVVAEEKAENIEKLRPTIKALGKEKLKQLILRVFDEIRDADYSDGKLARNFGLSRATYSRFCGSKWHGKESTIPALWMNTAQVLSQNPAFKEMLNETGFRAQVQNTLKRGRQHNGERIERK